MFDYDKWQEIFSTIRKNKLRTALTILGIFWGIFMIIILLGGGNSFRDGVTRGFGNWATNSGFVWGQRATVSYEGFLPGRYINFENSDTRMLQSRIKELKHLAPRNGLGGDKTAYFEDKSGVFDIMGDYPEYNKIEIQNIELGRFINDKDIQEFRKVVVIGLNVRKVLFGEDVDPIGKFITIRKINFQVVGVIKPVRTDNNDQINRIHIPFTTFQRSFNYGNHVGWYAYSAHDGYDVAEVEEKIVTLLKQRTHVHPLDEDAIGHFNLQEEFNEINGLFTGLEYFTWFVGISTLFAGIIGISNIMLIIVKERTKEIGIRKSLGATPMSIISLILQESVFLTMVGGYTALIFGLLLLELVAGLVPQGGDMPFAAPTVNPGVVLAALGILVVGGMIAGILPARRAAAISPIEAIRTEG